MDVPFRTSDMLDNLQVCKTSNCLQYDPCPSDNTHRSCSRLYHLPQLLLCLVREAYNIFLHAGSYTTGIDFMEEILDSLEKVVDTSGGLGGNCCGAL